MNKELILEKYQNIRICATFYWNRSGSCFVQSLLDSHNQVFTIFDTCLAHFYEENWLLLFKQKKPHPTDLVDKFLSYDHFQHIFSIYDRDTDIAISKESFRKYMLLISEYVDITNSKNFFIAISMAIELSLKRDISQKNIIAYHLHAPNPKRVKYFQRDFPHCLYIGTYRSGIRSLNSHIESYKITQGNWSPYLKESLYGWKYVQYIYNLNIIPLSLEELHTKPEQVLKNVCNYLNISFEGSLFESTRYGAVHHGCCGSRVQIQGFNINKVKTNVYKKNFSLLDKFIIDNLQSYHKEYEYKKSKFRIFCFILFLLPMKLEYTELKKHFL